jgi:serine/threonine-protein kinase HipA
VAGLLRRVDERHVFTYGRSYLQRDDAVAIYEPELPLRTGVIEPPRALDVAGCIADAGPDAWGQRVIRSRLDLGDRDPDLLTFLLASDSDRFGALDLQESAADYVPRSGSATLTELLEVAERIETGQRVPPSLADAAMRGTSLGGARPKATVVDGDRHYVAKFPVSTDSRNVIGGEALAMELARRVGLNVAPTKVVKADGKRVLLVERFDRAMGGTRRRAVSALTILGLRDYPDGRYATYVGLAEHIRRSFSQPDATLRELFARISFNMCITNTDDHARNHAALVEGTGSRTQLVLSPAYDLCPQPRLGDEAAQAMAYGPRDQRRTRLDDLARAATFYHLDEDEAHDIIDRHVEVISEQYDDAADVVGLPGVDRDQMRGRQFLHRSIVEGYRGEARANAGRVNRLTARP